MAPRYSDPEWWEMHPDLVASVLLDQSMQLTRRDRVNQVVQSVAELINRLRGGRPTRYYKRERTRLTVTVEEAAEMLGISRSLAYDATKKGDIPSVKIGRRVLVPTALLHEMLSPVQRGD